MKTSKQIEREILKKAIAEFLENGGKIDKKEPDFDFITQPKTFQCHNENYSWRRGPSPRVYQPKIGNC